MCLQLYERYKRPGLKMRLKKKIQYKKVYNHSGLNKNCLYSMAIAMWLILITHKIICRLRTFFNDAQVSTSHIISVSFSLALEDICEDSLKKSHRTKNGEREEALSQVSRYMLFHISLQRRHNGHNGVSNHQPYDCLLNRVFMRRSKKKSKPRVTGLCAGNSPVTGEFPAQMASNAENVSNWWRHHVSICLCLPVLLSLSLSLDLCI